MAAMVTIAAIASRGANVNYNKCNHGATIFTGFNFL